MPRKNAFREDNGLRNTKSGIRFVFALACVLTPMAGFEVVRKAAATHPDVVIPYGHVNVDEPGVMREIQQFAYAGFKGVKMHRPKYGTVNLTS